jgi:hypothetical protein
MEADPNDVPDPDPIVHIGTEVHGRDYYSAVTPSTLEVGSKEKNRTACWEQW